MRVIHNASLIILVIDIFRKIPIDEVEILCNGLQNPYLKKDSGYYIFCDLQPGNYKIEIFSPGFIKKEINCTLEFGECKKIVSEMSFKSTNPSISRLPRIELLIKDKNKDEILTNQDAKIIMKNPVSFLKLINNAKKTSMGVVLNVENIHSLHFQNYIYEFIDNGSNDEKKSDKDKKDGEDSKDEDKERSSDDELDDLLNDLDDEEKNGKDKKESENSKDEDKGKSSDDELDDLLNDLDDDKKDDEDESSDEEEKDLDEDDKDDEEKKESDEKDNDSNESKKDNSDEKLDKSKGKNDKVSEELFFLGYDIEYNAYILLNELQRDLKVGGQFFPFWNLSSDDKGKIVVPIFPKFMNKSFFKIEVKVNDSSKIIKIDTSKFNRRNAISRKVSLKF